ncbi:methyltransferase [Blastopirellula marina]|uniref:Methyltransferase n=1 Tax=Blastopirellula marina TaxID=124 RepID=A0A2S8F2Y4_9BACT|nr:methyltransferase [Blastopirellula marina]PQO26503.1 methyltransferase [Blastopirellula marina]PQO46863.1 methyltransferase [Blastopirellula marina]PTL40816.1 methyltransferase domain-containing protein [Blastopirellula marina]
MNSEVNGQSALRRPATDPTPIFEHFRGMHGSELLTAAVAHFDLFGRLSAGSLDFEALRQSLQLKDRPAVVLLTALKAMGLIQEIDGKLALTELAQEHLVPGGAFDCGNYIGLAAQTPGVLTMVQLLKTNRPLGSDEEDAGGAAFIYRDGIKSAMEAEDSARHFTMALAGRAKNVAPFLADAISLEGAKLLLDVGGGTGIYSHALLQKNPQLNAIVFDRPQVLKIAAEMTAQYGVADRCQLVSGDMFADALPAGADTILLSNILHDWDKPECQQLVDRCAQILPPGGRLLIHDVFLNDALDGPLPVALYSASLFSFTEGRAYSGGEYREMLTAAGLTPQPIVPTLVHCGVLAGVK